MRPGVGPLLGLAAALRDSQRDRPRIGQVRNPVRIRVSANRHLCPDSLYLLAYFVEVIGSECNR